MIITIEQFKKCFPNNKYPEQWTEAINRILPKYGITTLTRIVAFLAQCGHESDGFTDLTENLNYSAQGLAETWPKRYAVDPTVRPKVPNELAVRLGGHPEAIANNVYANRLGNGTEASGDGWRNRGYGPLQYTGKGIRLEFARKLGRTLEETQAYLLTYEGGIESACYFWTSKGLNRLADAGDVLGCTKRINGGTNGLADRKARTEHIAAVMA